MSKAVLAVFGGVLGIACGEALKLGFVDWHQLTALQYWMAIGVQVAALIAVYTGGLYTPKPQGLDAAAEAHQALLSELGKD